MAYSSEKINLPEPSKDSGFSVEQAIQKRRSVRAFSNKPLTLIEISQLLWSAQGITSDEGLRSAPSAGALYPLVLYLVVGNVAGLQPGIYRYSSDGHQLVRIQEGDSRNEVTRAALEQSWIRSSAMILIFSAHEKKTTGKYGQRGIRYIHIEVGHSAQNVFLQVQSLGLSAAVVGAFDDSLVGKILSLPTQERALYLMPVGRPQSERD